MAQVVRLVDGLPMGSVAEAVQEVGGAEHEYFIDGTASVVGLADGQTEYRTNGRWNAAPTEQRAPFRTRIIVVRPGNPDSFNGTVIVVWNNVTAGESFESPARAARLVADGFAIVGVSAQQVGVEGLDRSVVDTSQVPVMGNVTIPHLKSFNPDRYSSLSHPGDDYCYDIFAQVGQLIGPDRPRGLDPLADLDVRRLIVMGASQSAVRLGAYINGVHPLAPVYDAYLLIVYPSTPAALNKASAPAGLPQLGGTNPGNVLLWHQHCLRDDLNVPIIVLNSEFEAAASHPNRQHDSEFVRSWEIPGSGHMGMADPDQLQLVASMGFTASSVSFAPVVRGALSALHVWLKDGIPPFHQPQIRRVDDTGVLERDEHGNAVGGIRMPDLEAPLGTHVAESVTDDLSKVGGNSSPFAADKVRALYPTKEAYTARYKAAVEHLVETRAILADDAPAMLATAEAFAVPD